MNTYKIRVRIEADVFVDAETQDMAEQLVGETVHIYSDQSHWRAPSVRIGISRTALRLNVNQLGYRL